MKRTCSFSKFNLILDTDSLENNVTGLGQVEDLRPSVDGMTERVPSTLLSVERNSEQAGSRVCSADRNTGKNVDKPDFELIVPVNDAESDSFYWIPALNQKGKKGNKRAHSSSEEMREKEIERKSTTIENLESEKEVDYIVNIESSLPPESKAAKPLPSQQELAEMKLMTAVNVFLIICKTKANVKMAASSSNLKCTFKSTSGRVPTCRRRLPRNYLKELIPRAGGRSRAGEPLKKRLAKLESGTLPTNSRTAFKENRRPPQDLNE